MYLVSIYFDEKTNKKIQRLVDQVSKKTGNRYMIDAQVPPHITICAFETRNEEAAKEALAKVAEQVGQGEIGWVSVGQFFPQVIFLTALQNQYLQTLAKIICETVREIEDVKVSPYYEPCSWLPHTTIAKKLSKEEMTLAFEILQNSFGIIWGQSIKIGLAKPNPHRDIISFDL